MKLPLLFTLPLVAIALPVTASEYDDALRSIAQDRLEAIASEGFVIDAVRAMNDERAGYTQAEIDAQDQAWRAQVGAASAPLIDALMANSASQELAKIRDASDGLFTEIFVMGNKGLNVAASDVTSDYWQGDEAKWQETYQVGPGSVHISEVELDESTQTYQAQVSVTVADPDSSTAIGAITFGVNVEYLE